MDIELYEGETQGLDINETICYNHENRPFIAETYEDRRSNNSAIKCLLNKHRDSLMKIDNQKRKQLRSGHREHR